MALASGNSPAGTAPESGEACPPADRLVAHPDRRLGFYVHVPYCAVRCGYCDFNTYTPAQLQPMGVGDYTAAALAEIDLAAAALGPQAPPLSTVFFGGGTPTMATDTQLATLLGSLHDHFGLGPGAEVTLEANPETLTPARLDGLLASGFTRLSLGMQSADESVLTILERRHSPGRALQVARWAHQAGWRDVSLDLIYGTPGETLTSWRATLDAALAVDPEHVSAYSLIVEEGTPMARRIARGELEAPDEDDQADKYLLAEQVLAGAGLENYEISNWARPGHEAGHNLAYWHSDDWWGIGPGAHSHLDGVRWWNVKHPGHYAQMLGEGRLPVEGHEILDGPTQHEERLLLGLRLRDGLPMSELDRGETRRMREQVARGLVVLQEDRARLTLRGRLLADAVTRDVLA
ncbi:radical SAM family heme chaperone HemW [Propionibacterium sp.]|uniref:radical SAM family heme chaperone HemW n=1 Tax=Propionibacterium sp. TaxID=1977903 RepID=UPI0039E9E54C